MERRVTVLWRYSRFSITLRRSGSNHSNPATFQSIFVVLHKTLDPKLLPMGLVVPCMAAQPPIGVWMCVWMVECKAHCKALLGAVMVLEKYYISAVHFPFCQIVNGFAVHCEGQPSESWDRVMGLHQTPVTRSSGTRRYGKLKDGWKILLNVAKRLWHFPTYPCRAISLKCLGNTFHIYTSARVMHKVMWPFTDQWKWHITTEEKQKKAHKQV